MSKQYDNTGKGALWANGQWEAGSKAPKWTGKIVADRAIQPGEEIPLSVWPAERKGESSPVMRLTINRWKEQKEQRQEPAPEQGRDFDDDIPF